MTRYRFYLNQAISREKAYFLTRLYLKFPAFSLKKLFASLFGATSLALITEFSPDELVHLPLENLTQFIIPKSSQRILQAQTRPLFFYQPDLSNHPPNPPGLEEALKEVDKAIEKEFGAFPNTLQSIKRIGPIYSAGIFSEIGDIHRFHTEDAIAKFAGLT